MFMGRMLRILIKYQVKHMQAKDKEVDIEVAKLLSDLDTEIEELKQEIVFLSLQATWQRNIPASAANPRSYSALSSLVFTPMPLLIIDEENKLISPKSRPTILLLNSLSDMEPGEISRAR
jgi:hypothetical protein